MRKKIGIVSAGWNDEYQRVLLQGITKACKWYNYDTLSFTSINIDFTSEAQNKFTYNIFNLINDKAIDGLILILNTIYYDEVIQHIFKQTEQMHIPIVCLDYEHDNMMSVGTDNYLSARIMVEHLFEGNDRKQFACISGPLLNPESESRVQAFKDVVTEHLGCYDENYIYQGDFQYDSGKHAAEYWYNSDKGLPDAVFCCNDKMAMSFLERCLKYGYRVPEDIKITGFDNSTGGQISPIPISSLQCPLNDIGKKSVQMLKEVFEGKTPNPRVRLSGIPFFRASSGVTSEERTINEYRNLYQASAAQTKSENESLYTANLMIERFSFCNSIDDFMNHLHNIIHAFPSEELYLCFTKEQFLSMGDAFELDEKEEFEYMPEEYPDQMHLLVHFENGEFFQPQTFETIKILPTLDYPKNKRMDYIIIPLYFMGKTHGYCVLGNCSEIAYTGAFQTWITLLSYAVNNVYMRHDIFQKAKRLEFLYERDSMTETYNRLGFKKHADRMLQTCIENSAQMMVLFADMDGLKLINDKFGHEEGDKAICAFSDILKKNCKHGELVSRFGGDEMVVFGINYSQDMAIDFIYRFQKSLDQYNAARKHFDLKVSMGYEIYTPTPSTDIEACINYADAVMYKEKNRRKQKQAEQDKFRII